MPEQLQYAYDPSSRTLKPVQDVHAAPKKPPKRSRKRKKDVTNIKSIRKEIASKKKH